MAETEQPQTVEINDAYFCQHFKEVVSIAHHPARLWSVCERAC